MKNYRFILSSVAALLCLVACQPRTSSRGNVIVEESFSSFVVGKTTANEILEKCGTPSLHKNNYSWIYIGSKVEEDIFNHVKPTYKFIVKMTFDDNGILKNIEKIDDSKDTKMDEEVTRLMTENQAALKVSTTLNERKNH
jgi:outer membrane protein assembly factor BamE (lipoprotein component of BamABCDE complex)